jgi:hypothetical protein
MLDKEMAEAILRQHVSLAIRGYPKQLSNFCLASSQICDISLSTASMAAVMLKVSVCPCWDAEYRFFFAQIESLTLQPLCHYYLISSCHGLDP